MRILGSSVDFHQHDSEVTVEEKAVVELKEACWVWRKRARRRDVTKALETKEVTEVGSVVTKVDSGNNSGRGNSSVIISDLQAESEEYWQRMAELVGEEVKEVERLVI